MHRLRRLLDVHAGIFLGELRQRLVPQRRRDLLGEEFHAFARELIGHVAELKLDQQIADLGFLDQILNAPGDRFRTADDDRLRGFEFVPIFHVAQEFASRL